GSGCAPGCASTTSKCTVLEPTSRTPSLMYGTLLPAAPCVAPFAAVEPVPDPGAGDLPWTRAKDEKGEGRKAGQEGQEGQEGRVGRWSFAGDSTADSREGAGGRRKGSRLRPRVGGVS